MVNEPSHSRLAAFVAALKERASGPPPLPDLTPVRQVAAGPDLCDRFVRHASRAGMSVRLCLRRELSAVLIDELRASLIDSVILTIDADSPLSPDIAGVSIGIEAAGTRALKALNDETWFAAAAGVTGVRCAVAETGSLLVTSGADSPRSTSLIPPIHIALVAASQIVPDLVDALAALCLDQLPAAATLITGPSKTADIEGVLVTGVHGPGRVSVIVVTDA